MRPIIYLLLLSLLSGFSAAQAQEVPMQFGKVQAQDFATTAADTSSAVILYDIGRSRLDGGTNGDFQVNFVRTTRIHILRKSGYRWATVDVPLYRYKEQLERLRELKGYTYNLVDSKVVKEKLSGDAIFQEQSDPSHKVKRFTLPNVREGSIIEFTYSINSDFLFNLQDWQFQYSIPVLWSDYQTVIPGFFRYKQLTRGYLRATQHEEKIIPYATRITFPAHDGAPSQEHGFSTQAISERWIMKNVPPFQEEAFLTSAHDYISSLSFELNTIQYPEQKERAVTSTWEQINEDLNKHELFGKRLVRGPLVAEAQRLAAQFPDTLQRAKAVLALVQKTVRYNQDRGIYAVNSLRQVTELHQGDAAEMNLLLVQTLREAGLPANPVLLSTRAHGQILLDMPVLTQFNYVVAQVPLPRQPNALIDATEPLAPLGTLPERCLNMEGRLIAEQPTKGRWISLKPAQRYVQYTTANLKVDERGALQGTAHFEQGGYAGLRLREQLRDTNPQSYVTELQRQHPDWVLTKPTFQHVAELDQPLVLEASLQIPGGEAPAPTLYLNVLRHFAEMQNPFRAEERHYPVSFGTTREQTAIITLTLPAGYEVQELPAPLTVALPGNAGRFTYQAAQPTPQTVVFTSRLQLAKAEYSPQEYAALRELYQRSAAKSAEVLVLHHK